MWGDNVAGLLNALSDSDWVLGQYTGAARVWSTVTPVVLPGYDDRDAETAERLLRRAFHHAGFSERVVSTLSIACAAIPTTASPCYSSTSITSRT